MKNTPRGVRRPTISPQARAVAQKMPVVKVIFRATITEYPGGWDWNERLYTTADGALRAFERVRMAYMKKHEGAVESSVVTWVPRTKRGLETANKLRAKAFKYGYIDRISYKHKPLSIP